MEKKNIYDLKLHEGMMVAKGVYALRVPSGWIYTLDGETSIFVPYDNRFMGEV